MNKLLLLFTFFLPLSLFSNGITVSGVSFNQSLNELSFTLEWENSWTLRAGEPDLFDAAWVFVKYAPNGGDNWSHAEILDSIPIQNYIQYISYDDLGMMVYKSPEGPDTFGPQQFTLELAPLKGGYQDFKVFATEMVFIDDGDFYAGDGTSSGRFYEDGNTSTPWLIENENAIMRGNGVGEFHQEGSASMQDIGADFPKGYNSFYCMKYKITTQQYMDFLNCLTRAQQNTRVQADLSGVTASNKYVMTDSPNVQNRNPIACNVNIGTGCIEFYLDLDDSNAPNSANDGANIVMNHLTAADIAAYMDWSGMRPMTELEFEKICRGRDVLPIGGEYAWGTDTYNAAGATTNSGANNEATANVGILPNLYKIAPIRSGYAATGSSGRNASCATFWGNMDIHNLGEFMYGVESVNFSKNSYGDGNLDNMGNADVPGWTVLAQLLCTQNISAPAIEPISQGKNSIGFAVRSPYFGARGIRKLIQE